jgi:hypothetical protein
MNLTQQSKRLSHSFYWINMGHPEFSILEVHRFFSRNFRIPSGFIFINGLKQQPGNTPYRPKPFWESKTASVCINKLTALNKSDKTGNRPEKYSRKNSE